MLSRISVIHLGVLSDVNTRTQRVSRTVVIQAPPVCRKNTGKNQRVMITLSIETTDSLSLYMYSSAVIIAQWCCRTWTMERQKDFVDGDRASR